MRKHYAEMHETLSWQPILGEEEIPGLENLGPAQLIPGRKDQEIRTITEDKVSNVLFTLPPQYEPHAGDRIDGAKVLEVESVKTVRSKVLRWLAYARE